MKRSEARRIAEDACDRSPYPAEQYVAVLEAFGLIKIDDEPKETDDADAE